MPNPTPPNSYTEGDANRVINLYSTDGGNTWVPQQQPSGGGDNMIVFKNSVYAAVRSALNLIEGANITLTVADDPTNNQVDVTIAGAAGGGGGGAPTTVDYLVGTADAGLSGEIVVGTSPGGELGGTWASPTVDATHSGSSHAATQTAAEATASTALSNHAAAGDPHTAYQLESALTEDVQDIVGALLVDSADVDYTYNDAGNAQTIAVKAFTGDVTKTSGAVATTVTAIQGNTHTAGAPTFGHAYVHDNSTFKRTGIIQHLGAGEGVTYNTSSAQTSVLNNVLPIPANSLKVGDFFELNYSSIVYNNSGANRTAAFALFSGATDLSGATTTASLVSGLFNVYNVLIRAFVVVTAIGVSGGMKFGLTMDRSNAGSHVIAESLVNSAAAAVTVDTTVARDIDLRCTLSASHASLQITAKYYTGQRASTT